MRGSLAYRTNESAILRGDVPNKYLRILPYIPEGKILELGSAEGVLALSMAKQGRKVIAVEASKDRHEAAKTLAKVWEVNHGVRFVHGKIQDNLKLLSGMDALVAVRSIYYLRENLDAVFNVVSQYVPTVVLCGNRHRADRWRKGKPHEPLGPYNKYASREGMRELLERHGYVITREVREGDEIVVGNRE